MEIKNPEKRDHVIFVDSYGNPHEALVTDVFGGGNWNGKEIPPSMNVVYVSTDESRKDSYGLQVERGTSVCHRTVQPAWGMYWMWPGDTLNPKP